MNRTNYPFEYTVPLYRQVVCDHCHLGYDSHQHMDLVCPDCGGKLVPIVE